MIFTEKSYGNAIELAVLDTKKFKTDQITFLYRIPTTKFNLVNARALSAVLGRGTRDKTNLLQINRYLSSLYDVTADCSASKSPAGDIAFRICASMLDDSLSLDGTAIFDGTVDFIYEMLFDTLVSDGKMDAEYTESEKKHLDQIIRAEVNNKDSYALLRASQIAYEGTPFAVHSELEDIKNVTADSLYEMLGYITKKCPLVVVFGGNYTEKKALKIDSLLKKLSSMRDGCDIESEMLYSVDTSADAIDVTESIPAKQGRMVLNYSVDKALDSASILVFNEIFGASPVSRLFMNVRERLSLCYYCSSSYNAALARIIIRSGIDIENKDKAITEINRQISLLSDSDNISDEELETAKKSLCCSYRSMQDNVPAYCEWYIRRRVILKDADIEKCIREINSVTAKDVERVARSVRLQLSYFLDGTAK